MGLGLGLVGSAFTILNAYLLKPIDLPNPRALYSLSLGHRRHAPPAVPAGGLRGAATGGTPPRRTGGRRRTSVHAGRRLDPGPARDRQLLRDARRAAGPRPIAETRRRSSARRGGGRRALAPTLAIPLRCGSSHRRPTTSSSDVSASRWSGSRSRTRNLAGQEAVSFWAPLTMAGAFPGDDPWAKPDSASLVVIGRLRQDVTAGVMQPWLEAWLRRRFPPPSDAAPVAVRLDSLATRLPLDGGRRSSCSCSSCRRSAWCSWSRPPTSRT